MKGFLSIIFLGQLVLIIELSQCDAKGGGVQFTGFFAPIKRFECRFLQPVKVIIPWFPNCNPGSQESDSSSSSSSSSSSEEEANQEPESPAEDEPESLVEDVYDYSTEGESESTAEDEPESPVEDEPERPGVTGTPSFAIFSHDFEDALTVEGQSCTDYPCTFTWTEDVGEDTDIMLWFSAWNDAGALGSSSNEYTICEASRMKRDSWPNMVWRLFSNRVAGGADGCNIKAGTYNYEEKDGPFYFTPEERLPCDRVSVSASLSHKNSEQFMQANMAFSLPEKGPNCTEIEKSEEETDQEPESSAEDEPERPGVIGTPSFSIISHDFEDAVTVQGAVCVDDPCTFTWTEDVGEDTDIMLSFSAWTKSGPVADSLKEYSICDASRMKRDSWLNIAWRVLSSRVAGGADGCNIKAGTYKYEEKDREFYFAPEEKLPCEELTVSCSLAHENSERFLQLLIYFDLPENSPNCTKTES